MNEFQNNAELKILAKSQLRGKWGLGVLLIVIYAILQILISMIPILGSVIQALISGTLTVGLSYCYLSISRNEEVKLEDLFFGFKLFLKTFLITLLQGLIVCIGYLLLIIPGIIASLSLSQCYYILIDNPNLTSIEVLKLSYKMMQGHRIRFILLCLSFLGWAILASIPLGLGWFILVPYMNVTFANFYNELRVSNESTMPIRNIAEFKE